MSRRRLRHGTTPLTVDQVPAWLAAVQADPQISEDAKQIAAVIAAGITASGGTFDLGAVATFTVGTDRE